MIAYVDASVILRLALQQSNALATWRQIDLPISSVLVRAECLRSLDRMRLHQPGEDHALAQHRATILRLLATLRLVALDAAVLDRVSQPMPTELGTLDAIHLTTAVLWRETSDHELVLATHDGALATGARAHGFRVIGVA